MTVIATVPVPVASSIVLAVNLKYSPGCEPHPDPEPNLTLTLSNPQS